MCRGDRASTGTPGAPVLAAEADVPRSFAPLSPGRSASARDPAGFLPVPVRSGSLVTRKPVTARTDEDRQTRSQRIAIARCLRCLRPTVAKLAPARLGFMHWGLIGL